MALWLLWLWMKAWASWLCLLAVAVAAGRLVDHELGGEQVMEWKSWEAIWWSVGWSVVMVGWSVGWSVTTACKTVGC